MNKETEKQELRTLMAKGIPVTIGGKTYTMHEPTLAVMDAMSEEWLEFPELPDDMDVYKAIEIGKKEASEHAPRMARVIAMALLGESMFGLLGTWRLKRMQKRIMHSIKPSELKPIVEIMTATSGLVNFTISMKLMSTAVTTKAKTDIE